MVEAYSKLNQAFKMALFRQGLNYAKIKFSNYISFVNVQILVNLAIFIKTILNVSLQLS